MELWGMCLQILPDGVHKVGLTKANPTVDKQRVIGQRGSFRHCSGGRVRKLVRRADDEVRECVSLVELSYWLFGKWRVCNGWS